MLRKLRKPNEVMIGDMSLEDVLKTDQKSHLHDVDLSGVNLHGYDLSNIQLDNVNLRGANLSEANLSRSLIRNSNFSATNLSSAIVRSTNIFGTSFFSAILQYTDFSHSGIIDSDLSCASLMGAKLISVDFNSSKFRGADFSRANISDSYFNHANLYDTNIEKAIGNNLEYLKGKILKEPIIGYKKMVEVMITLEIPAGAIVFSTNGTIFRTNKAKVIDMDRLSSYNDAVYSYYDNNDIEYYMDKTINVEDFDLIYNAPSASGIYFGMSIGEAANC